MATEFLIFTICVAAFLLIVEAFRAFRSLALARPKSTEYLVLNGNGDGPTTTTKVALPARRPHRQSSKPGPRRSRGNLNTHYHIQSLSIQTKTLSETSTQPKFTPVEKGIDEVRELLGITSPYVSRTGICRDSFLHDSHEVRSNRANKQVSYPLSKAPGVPYNLYHQASGFC